MNYTNSISEEYVASAILNDSERAISKLKSEGVTQDYFHNHLPKLIWRSASKLFKQGKTHEIELLEFSDEIKGQANGAELSHAISNIRTEWCGWELLKQHIKTLKTMQATRFAYNNLNDALSSLQDGDSPEEICQAAKGITEGINKILESESGWKTAEQGVEEFADLLRQIHNQNSTSGVPSGIQQIDEVTGGLGTNELWVIGAQTSGGKTVLMFQIMANFLALGKNVLLFSLETEANRVHARLAANTQSIEMNKILGNGISPMVKNDFIKLRSYVEDVIASDCLTICDSDSITMESIIAKSQQIADTGKTIGLIVVDYIQLVSLTNGNDKSRQEQVAEVTRSLKQLAKRYRCPVLTATQLNDDGKVRESRAIAHDSDVLLMICDGSEGVFVLKNRNGERNKTLDLKLNGAYQRFE